LGLVPHDGEVVVDVPGADEVGLDRASGQAGRTLRAAVAAGAGVADLLEDVVDGTDRDGVREHGEIGQALPGRDARGVELGDARRAGDADLWSFGAALPADRDGVVVLVVIGRNQYLVLDGESFVQVPDGAWNQALAAVAGTGAIAERVEREAVVHPDLEL